MRPVLTSSSFDDYIGIPFVERGRDRSGLDCWGLLWLVYKEKLGILLPEFNEQYATIEDIRSLTAAIHGNMDGWEPTATPIIGDGLLMTQSKEAAHIGIIVSVDIPRVLHVERRATSTIVRYDSALMAKRVVGAYHYE